MILVMLVDVTYVYHSLLFPTKFKLFYMNKRFDKQKFVNLPQEIHVYQLIDYLYEKREEETLSVFNNRNKPKKLI